MNDGSSLLPVGVIRIRGSFVPGAALRVESRSAAQVARGLVRYGAAELAALVERRRADGGLPRGDMPAIHRDDLVLFPSQDGSFR